MKKKLKARVLSALISASMVLNCIPAYAIPNIEGTGSQIQSQGIDLDEVNQYEVATSDNASSDGEGGFGLFRMINDRFTVDGVMYKEIGPEKAQVIGIEDEVEAVVIPEIVEREHDDGSIEKYTEISIAADAFMDNDDIVSVAILLEIEEIADEMFWDCDSLKTVTYPNTVEKIGKKSFAGCNALEGVVIPKSVVSIEEGAYENCKHLTQVILNEKISSVPDMAFAGCSSLESFSFSYVTEIGKSAFAGCKSLKQINISNTIAMDKAAFENCSGLQEVVLGESLVKLNDNTFSGCSALRKINLDHVKEIGDFAFYGCKKLEVPSLSMSLTTIGAYAFSNCFGMYDSFWNHCYECTMGCDINPYNGDGFVCEEGLKCALLIPDSVTFIGAGALYLDDGIDETEIVCAFDGTYVDMYPLIHNAAFNGETYIKISDSQATENGLIYKIVDDEWGGSQYIVEEDQYSGFLCTYKILEMPQGYDVEKDEYSTVGKVELISINSPNYEFLSLRSRTSLNWIYIPNYIEYWGGYLEVIAIADNFQASDIYDNYVICLADNVSYIGKNAFKDDEYLMQIIFESDELTIGESAFENCSSFEGAYYDVADEASINVLDNTESNNYISYVLPEQICSIGDRAFAGCDLFGAIMIPYSVENWGCEVFSDCENLEYAIFASAEYFGEENSENEDNILITELPNGMFRRCRKLTDIGIPNTVKHIGDSAFEDCKNFAIFAQYEFVEENGNKDILWNVDEDGNLPRCAIPESINTIGARAFYGCSQWKNVYAGSQITNVGMKAFSNGTQFTSDSSRVQLLLVESLNNDAIATTFWNGTDDVEKGAIVTLSATEIKKLGDLNPILINRNAHVYISEDVKLVGDVLLERDATIHILPGATLTLEGKLLGPTDTSDTSNLMVMGSLVGSGTIDDNVEVHTVLTSDMITIPESAEFTGEEVEVELTVKFALDNYIETYEMDDPTTTNIIEGDFTCTYSNNLQVGTATVTIEATETGRLLGGRVKKTFSITKAMPKITIDNIGVNGANVEIVANVEKLGPVDGGRDSVKFTATEQLTEEQRAKGEVPNTLVKTVMLNSGANKTATASVKWSNVYNGVYDLEIVYSGDANHNPSEVIKTTFTVDGYTRPSYNGSINDSTGGSDDGGSGSTGGSGGGGNGGGSTGGSGQSGATQQPQKEPERVDYGVMTMDPVKGAVSSIYGVITSKLDKNRSEWVLDGAAALIWGGNPDNYWRLQYVDGSYAKGTKAVDANGNPYEDYLWEFIDGEWWAFDSNGLAKMGWIYDEKYKGWFYMHIKHGMQTGWICAGDKWYYLDPTKANCEGKMYAAQWTPDGYYVDESGAWDGRPQMLKAQ